MANIGQKWLGSFWVLVPFTSGRTREYSASELSRRLGAAQRTVARELTRLEKAYFVEYEYKGRNKVYSLSSRLLSLVELVTLVEFVKSVNFRMTHNSLLPLFEELDGFSYLVFGSYAKGLEKKGSDIDLVLFARKSAKFEKIFARYPFRVQAHYCSFVWFVDQFKKGNALPKEILKDHILFGDIRGMAQMLGECK